jgi:DNA-binding SARP family transcriptional activator
VHVALLGPLEVRTDGDPGEIVEVAGARLRALLIMLALHPGQLVTVSQLIDGLWPQEMPAGAGNALQALVSRLRRALPEAVLESRPAGYQLNIDPRRTDIVRFEDLVTAGRAQLRQDPAAAGQTLRQALALWRGPALADVAGTDFGQAAIARLDELRLTAIEQRVDADLRTGDTASLVAELEGLVIAHPMREPLAARLMRALHAAGRRGAALEVPIRKPRMYPRASSIAIAQVCLARSARIRPASGANRAIGNDRSRSKNPFSRSVDSPVAVFSVVNSEFCTMMPGSANSRYAFGEPPIAPPNT